MVGARASVGTVWLDVIDVLDVALPKVRLFNATGHVNVTVSTVGPGAAWAGGLGSSLDWHTPHESLVQVVQLEVPCCMHTVGSE